jgi:integrase
VASIRKKPSGKWEVRLFVGNRLVSRSFNGKREAERYAAHSQAQLDRGEWKNPRDGKIVFEEWVQVWWKSKHELRPSTRTLYEYLLRYHVEPAFRGQPLASIRAEDVDEWKVTLRESGISASTQNKAYRLFAEVMGLAVIRDRIAKSPTLGVKAPQEPRHDVKAYSPEQAYRIAEAIDPHYRVLVLTAAWTGLRWGEVAGLRPAKLDLLHRTITVDEQLTEVNGKHGFGPPKTETGKRIVSIPPFLVPLLEEQIATRARDGLVFPAKSGGPIRRSNFTRREWHPALTRAGVEKLPFHALRHTAVTIAIAAGFTGEQLTEWIGHSSIRVTLDRYGHLLPSSREAIADRMGAAFEAAAAQAETAAPVKVLRQA